MVANFESRLNTNQPKVCLVAILKNEEKFLDEWLVYHRFIGIDYFYLYDDDPNLPLKQCIAPHLAYCHVIDWNTPGNIKQGNQIRAYKHALDHFIKAFDWVIYLDADEFIKLERHSSIQELLSDYQKYTAISLKWRVFGHNGFFEDSRRLVTTSLTRRMKGYSDEVKTFTRTSAIADIRYPHYCELKYGSRLILGNDEAESQTSQGAVPAHINHYQCRSFMQWMNRIRRGDVNFDESNCTATHQWRTNEEACLHEFVINIAYNKNEFQDKTMLRHKFDIQEGISKLKRESITQPPGFDLSVFVFAEKRLQAVAKVLVDNAGDLETIGLYNGKAGLALFLFIYSRHYGIAEYKEKASLLIESISNEISQGTSITYSTGLSGFGALIEYLVYHGFIRANTNLVLSDIDELLHYHLISQPFKTLETNTGLTGIGRYYCRRLANPFNDHTHNREKINRQIVAEIIDLLEVPYSTYAELLSVIDFLSEAYPYVGDKEKLHSFLNYAVDKLETMAYEDHFFMVNLQDFDAVVIAITLFEAFEKTGKDTLKDHALKFFQRYCLPLFDPLNVTSISEPALDTLIRYFHLYKYVQHPLLEERIQEWPNHLSQTAVSVTSPPSISDLTLATGLVGEGLALLTLLSDHGLNWLKLITPVTYSSSNTVIV